MDEPPERGCRFALRADRRLQLATAPRFLSEAPKIPHRRNQFFLWEYGATQAAEVDPVALSRSTDCTDVRYFGGILAELDRLLGPRAMRFLLTWNLDSFAARFNDSVAILVGDEKYQVPSWAPAVRAVFKTGGIARNPLAATLGLPPEVSWRVILRDLRNGLLAARRRGGMRGRTRRSTPIFELPLGYHSLVDVSHVPFEERTVDVFFAGSMHAQDRWSPRPRVVARRDMVYALERVTVELPALDVATVSGATFGAGLGPREYSARLMQARVALCPRGNFDETFRLFEAAKSGCVVISEPLPDRWYYADVPAVTLERWSDLPALLHRLFGDEAGLAEVAARTRAWWEERVAERPVAEFIRARIDPAGAGGRGLPPGR